jgi:hypothetical protein
MKKFLFLLMLLGIAVSGCGGKDKVKPSADSLLTTQALSRIEEIKNAYEGKDMSTLRTRMDAKAADEILKGMDFEKAELTFAPKLVKIIDESVTVSMNWQGAWQTAKNKKLESRGTADLILQRETMKLMQIQGDNPFLIPLSALSQ